MASTTVGGIHAVLLPPFPIPKRPTTAIFKHWSSLPLVFSSSSSSSSSSSLVHLKSFLPSLSGQTRKHRTSCAGASKSRFFPRYVSTQQEGISEHDDGGDGGKEEVSRATLIWRAVKLPIYSVALVPLSVGSSIAYFQTGLFFTKRYLVLLMSSVLIITWLNLSNDVYDFDTGADKDKKESVVNIVGSRTVTHLAANASLAIGLIGLIWASAQSGDIRTILLLILAILCGYVYQCPPFRLSYQGLGEPLCFAAFGPFATTAFYLSQGNKNFPSEMFQLPISGTVLSASFFVGLTTTLILFCSHFHQIDGDQAVGKMSPLVRIGTGTASKVVKVAVIALYSLMVFLGFAKILPPISVFLCALTLPMGKLVLNFIEENHNDKIKIFMAKYYCVRLHALFGAALTASLVFARNKLPEYLPRLVSS